MHIRRPAAVIAPIGGARIVSRSGDWNVKHIPPLLLCTSIVKLLLPSGNLILEVVLLLQLAEGHSKHSACQGHIGKDTAMLPYVAGGPAIIEEL